MRRTPIPIDTCMDMRTADDVDVVSARRQAAQGPDQIPDFPPGEHGTTGLSPVGAISVDPFDVGS